jgi:hypothetical protein
MSGVEVRSPGDRWPQMLAKVAESPEAVGLVVVALDDKGRSAHLFDVQGTHRMLGADDELNLPELLPGSRAILRQFFE